MCVFQTNDFFLEKWTKTELVLFGEGKSLVFHFEEKKIAVFFMEYKSSRPFSSELLFAILCLLCSRNMKL